MVAEFYELIDRIIESVLIDDDSVFLIMSDGAVYKMAHEQDCCENVYLADVTGSWDDIVGQPVSSVFKNFEKTDVEYGIKGWTFYTIATFKGAVTLRWNGSSNGYYSIGVSFYQI